MLNLKRIAITGGVGSGKTTVCQLFQKLGACVVNADAIAHELLTPQTDFGQQVIRLLGTDILHNGHIDRKVVADKVFSNPQLLLELEHILHPAILKRIEELYRGACKSEDTTLFIVEIPLLFEIGAEHFYDAIIAVIADEQIARERSGYTTEEYNRRMHRQLAPKLKAIKAHYTIKNNGSLETLQNQVDQLNALLIGVSHP